MTDWGRIVEEQIRRAREAGAFENLPGTGEPLDWQENPYADPAWRAAQHLLKSNGFSLPWLENRRTIEDDLAAARQLIRHAARRRAEVSASGVHDQAWNHAVQTFEVTIEALNRRIFDYNLEVPSARFQRLPLNFEVELRKAQEEPTG